MSTEINKRPFSPMPLDPLLVKAVGYALEKRPCLISCRTLMGLNIIATTLRAHGHKVSVLTAGSSPVLQKRAVQDFDAGRTDYLLATTAMIGLGVLSIRKPAYITASHYMNAGYAEQLRGRLRTPPDNDHALEIEDSECSPPL